METPVEQVPRYIFRAYHLADTLRLKAIEPAMDMPATTRAATKLVYQLGDASFLFLYRFGSVVFFNVEQSKQDEIVDKIKTVIRRTDVLSTSDEFALEVHEDEKNSVQFERVIVDKLTLDRIEIIALVMAQSATLEFFEIKVDQLLARSGEISGLLKDTGRMKRTSRYINKFMGDCMSTKQELAASLYLLDKPDETWEDQVLDNLFRDAAEMFELKERYKTIGHKLKIIEENLKVISALLANRKAAFLEWLIIILIAIEVVLFVYELWIK